MDDYSSTSTFSATLRGAPLRVVSKPGLADHEEVPAAAQLCAELLVPAPAERALLLGCGNGALGVALARLLPKTRLALADTSLLALELAAQTLRANGFANVPVWPWPGVPAEPASLDHVVILMPPARVLARRWLSEALALLRPGGRLTIAGAKASGVQPQIADLAALCGDAHTLGYGSGCRVAEAIRPAELPAAPDWATAPGVAPGSWISVRAELPGGPVELHSLPGVFSADRLDAGTAFLLEQVAFAPGSRVLDVGCGYGPLGIAAAQAGAAHVDMLDVNLAAVAAASATIERLGLTNAAVHPSDALAAVAGRSYDLIVSNPPFHSGRAVDTRMAGAFIRQSRALLAPGGRLALVANRFLAYERLLAPHFDHVVRIAENRAYQVIVGTRAEPQHNG